MKKEYISEKQYIIDEELHNLLVVLRDSKETYYNICSRMRSQGVEIIDGTEEFYKKSVDELISFASSSIVNQKLIHDIKKGVLDES